MKLIVLVTILAFAIAGPVEESSFLISTPEELIIVPKSENPEKNEIKEENNYDDTETYGKEYWPQSRTFQVAQYIVYQLQSARQNDYTASEFMTDLTKQGFPEFITQYFEKQYEVYQSQSFGKSSYERFQYYYQHEIPQEIRQYVAQQIAQAYQRYQEFVLKNGQQPWKQELPGYPQSVAQYVTQMVKYYEQNGVTYLAAQYASQQLQQAQQYIQNALQRLEGKPQDIYQHVIQPLQQGQEYAQNAQKVYQAYETYHEYYIPYYAAQYALQQTQEAYEYFHSAYRYIRQQAQSKDLHFDQYVFEQIRLACEAIQTIYQEDQQQPFSKTSFSYDQIFSFDSEYVVRELKLVQQYAQKSQQFIQQLSAQDNVPQSIISLILQQFQQGLDHFQNAYQAAQQPYGIHSYQYVADQVQQALQYFQKAYQTIQQNSFGITINQQVEYTVQHAQNAYFAARQATYQGSYPGYTSYTPANTQGYYPVIQQVMYYIRNAQQYIQNQGDFPQNRNMVKQLTQAYHVYQLIQQFFQQGYLSQPIVQYLQQQVQQANLYLFAAYQSAQQQETQYMVQQLKYALRLAHFLQHAGQYPYTNGNQYEREGQTYYTPQYATQQLQMAQQYVLNVEQYIGQQLPQGTLQQYNVQYIQQQLQKIRQYIQNADEATKQEYRSQYPAGYVTQNSNHGYGYDDQKLRQSYQYSFLGEQYQPYQQYFDEKYQQPYKPKYPNNKQDYIQTLVQKDSHKNYQKVDQVMPSGTNYGSFRPYSSFTEQDVPETYGYFGPYNPTTVNYGQYHYKSHGNYDYQPYKPSQYEFYIQPFNNQNSRDPKDITVADV